MRLSRHIAILAAVLIVPLLGFAGMCVFSGQKLSTGDVMGMTVLALPNAVCFGLPQLACWGLWRAKKISSVSLWGGVLAADVVLVAFSVMFLTIANDGDSMGWIWYYAACIFLVPVGLLAGKAAGALAHRIH